MPVLRSFHVALLQRFFSLLDRGVFSLGRSKKLSLHLLRGKEGEDLAYFYLRRKGYVVVARDWRSSRHRGDIDLIAWDGDTLCFVEVKTRSSRAVATAESAVDKDKRRVLRRLAGDYLRRTDRPTVRFDVLSIYLGGARQPEIVHFPAAFGWKEDRSIRAI